MSNSRKPGGAPRRPRVGLPTERAVDAPAVALRPRMKILIGRRAIQHRIRAIARQISSDFHGESIHLVGILKGACIFLSDLIREIELETSIDFMAVSSYGRTTESSGQVRLNKDLDASIAGLNVILVEDILDTGLTLDYLLRILTQRRPKALRVAALLDKPSRRVKNVRADYVGFSIPNEFVVGYGLDYAENYRNLHDICVLHFPRPAGPGA
jgi:hypoxanthine phosphoribosyltransferase